MVVVVAGVVLDSPVDSVLVESVELEVELGVSVNVVVETTSTAAVVVRVEVVVVRRKALSVVV